jgi:putative ABC transport system permease protein
MRLPLRNRAAAGVDEEFEFHLDMRTNELIARGWTPEAARQEARRQFGDLESAREFCSTTDQRMEQRIMRKELWAEIRQDIAYALRTLRKSPAFTVVAVITLALGIGANTAIFSVVRGVLLRPLPFRDPESLVLVPAVYGAKTSPYLSPANAYDWRDQSRSFTSFSVIQSRSAVITDAGDPERLRGFAVSAEFFPLLGVQPVRGRLAFTPEEARWKGEKVVVLNETVWRTRFGGNPNIVGSNITLDNERYRVVGVAPEASAWPAGALVWFPFTMEPEQFAHSRGAVYLNAVARLKPGVSIEAAAADMKAVAARLATQYPDQNTGLSATVIPLKDWITGDMKRPLLLLLGGVACVFLIACANVANLLLVRGVSRERDFAVRMALGAGRARLLRQLATESSVLITIGAFAGLALGIVCTKLLVANAPPTMSRVDSIRVDGAVLSFTLLVALLTSAVFGLIPLRQISSPQLSVTLREGSRSMGGRRGGGRMRRVLVAAELALSVMLLAGAGLLIRSFDRLMNVDPGFRTESSVSFSLSLPDARYESAEKQALFMRELMTRLRAIPGVESAGAAIGLPLTSFGFSFSFTVAERPPIAKADEPSAEVRIATPDFFPTMGIRTVQGRGFNAADRAGSPIAFVITETAMKQFFPGESPIGKRIRMGWSRDGHRLEGEVVGVVADAKQSSLAKATLPQFYVPYDQWPVESFVVVMHGSRALDAMIADARRAVKEIDPSLAVSRVKSLEQVVDESVAQPRFYMSMLAAFAALALVLSAVGIYGVIAYLVGQRTREIGIRVALGATPSRVVRLVVREGIVMTAVGLVIGLFAALQLSSVMSALLFGVPATDVVTYAGVTGVLGLVALAASAIPASRAARVDPVIALRAEG